MVRLGKGKFRWLGLEKISSDCIDRYHFFFFKIKFIKKKIQIQHTLKLNTPLKPTMVLTLTQPCRINTGLGFFAWSDDPPLIPSQMVPSLSSL